ncbi:toprim domain-containing protein [Uruburuella testudinis]|uniref:Toprim domain-containing protein n=1 Tax=Uruburuella testudinis TaxID=1282863 RepID=A0ABY4DRD7_9NEIS|nr:toprim domain-containing protein [Uruburuella testudinis]UOO81602.1 toprim domain-containing protein [Uruburuella testudinis]
MKLNADTVRAEAQHRWHGILTALGVPSESLTNQHRPCPACGGKDRFRFDDRDGSGSFICNHYGNGAGDGFHFVMHFLDCDFPTALNHVAGVLGLTAAAPIPQIFIKAENKPAERIQDKQARLVSIWNKSQPLSEIDPVAAYLRGRGLTLNGLPQMLRYAELPYWTQLADGTPQQIGTHPTMLAAICNLDGEIQGLHQTYLKPAWIKPYGENGNHTPTFTKLNTHHPETGASLPAKKMQSRYKGALTGAAVQLYQMNEQGRLCVAEGIESALAARELFCLPVWACLSAGGMKALTLPDGLQELLIVADHDTPRPIGYEAAHSLAVRAIKQGIKVKLWQPQDTGDALDELNKRKRPAWAIGQQLKPSENLVKSSI